MATFIHPQTGDKKTSTAPRDKVNFLAQGYQEQKEQPRPTRAQRPRPARADEPQTVEPVTDKD